MWANGWVIWRAKWFWVCWLGTQILNEKLISSELYRLFLNLFLMNLGISRWLKNFSVQTCFGWSGYLYENSHSLRFSNFYIFLNSFNILRHFQKNDRLFLIFLSFLIFAYFYFWYAFFFSNIYTFCIYLYSEM